jgi:hypothetical protein
MPVMIPLLGCPALSAGTFSAAEPSMLSDLMYIAHIQIAGDRSVPGLNTTLTSGMEEILQIAPDGTFTAAFPAPFATQIALTTQLGKLALDGGASDQVSVGSPHGTFTLDFTPVAGTNLRADYYDVILHRITPTGFTVERIYTVTSPSVTIDGASLAPNSDYAFEIRTIKGHPQASLGDFAFVDLPYGSAIVFARTIHTGPAL